MFTPALKTEYRGGSRIFLKRGAPSRNGVIDWWGNNILKANMKKKASSQGRPGGEGEGGGQGYALSLGSPLEYVC